MGKEGQRKRRRVAHVGNLNDYFYGDQEFKKLFLQQMHETFDDGVYRYFVPEVNSWTDDLISIVDDLRETGFHFS